MGLKRARIQFVFDWTPNLDLLQKARGSKDYRFLDHETLIDQIHGLVTRHRRCMYRLRREYLGWLPQDGIRG